MSASNSGFDLAKVELEPSVWKSMTKPQFEALPFPERIRLVLGRKVKFLRKGEEISPTEALRGI
ncbi:MAG TPA: hypothetical protein VGQ36_25210 [Thermoanaerobaculia bacterium]|jgi:hypothetical protein|nr:hypothetical protein [Thermoanaerobaculia bacterium]